MKYWTIVFPGEFGQHVQETWSEEQIIKTYYNPWSQKMIIAGKNDMINRDQCIDDWVCVHWAIETDQFGNKINPTNL